MSSVPVQRLTDAERPALLAHFLALPVADRCLRFGTALAPRMIAAYVERLDFRRDALFGVHDEHLALAGVMHVAFEGREAELGVSVVPGHRRRGIGRALFARAFEHARNRGVPWISMQYLTTNAAVARLARRFGLHIVSAGVETLARLELPGPSAFSRIAEWASDALAACAVAATAWLAGWRHRRGTAGAGR